MPNDLDGLRPSDFGIPEDKVYIDPDTGCWLWLGANSGTGRGGGYGKISVGGTMRYIHRHVMELFLGRKIRRDHQVDHCCEPEPRRNCFFPGHLNVCTQSTNVKLAYKRRKKT